MKRQAPDIEALYRDFGERIYRFCYRLCGHAGDAEDLTQDVFVLAWRALPGFKGRSSLTTWLYRIALHRWQRSASTARPEVLPLAEDTPGAPAGGDPAIGAVERAWLEQAMAELPAPQRDAFILVKAEGLKYREAAEVLGIPQGTVQARVHAAGVRLRSLLETRPACPGKPRG